MLEIRLVGRERDSKRAMSVLWMEMRVVCSAATGWIVGGMRVEK